MTCLDQIIDEEIDRSTINQASGLKNYLVDYHFNFWLHFFNKIMPHCDILFNQLQQRDVDSVKVHKYISTFKSNIQMVRNSIDYDYYVEEEEEEEEENAPPNKRSRFEDSCKVSTKEVCVITVFLRKQFVNCSSRVYKVTEDYLYNTDDNK